MKKITRLEHLEEARYGRKAVIVPGSPSFGKPIPAAFILNLTGDVLRRLFARGMYIYNPAKKKGGAK